MSKATRIIQSISNLRIMNEKEITFHIGKIIRTNQGMQVPINDVPEGNITLLNDEKHTLVLDLFGERLEFTPDTLNFSDQMSKVINWDTPIIEVCNRHIDEINAHASIGKDTRRKRKEIQQNNAENQKERSLEVLSAIKSCRPYLRKDGYVILIDSITSGSTPFEYIINYKDYSENKSITINLSNSKYIWSTYLSKKKLCSKIFPDILDEVRKSGFDDIKLNF